MKNKIRTSIKFGILFLGIFLFLNNCQKEESITNQEENQIKSNIKIIKSTDFKIEDYSRLNQKIEDLKEKIVKSNKSNTNSKTVYSNVFDFYIDTEICTYFENEEGTYHSYTFPIYRVEENNLLENLLISFQEDGTYKAFLLSYDLSQEQLEALKNNQSIIGDYVSSFTEIEDINIEEILNNKVTYNQETGCYEDIRTFHTYNGTTWEFFENSICYHQGPNGCTVWTIYNQFGCLDSGSGGDLPSGVEYDNDGNIIVGSGGVNSDSSPITYTVLQPWQEIINCMPNILQIDGAINWLQNNKNHASTLKDLIIDKFGNCIEGTESYSASAIESGVNNTLITLSPLFKYPLNSNYDSLYPKLTSLLKNDIPKIANNVKVIDTIHSLVPEASKEIIKEALKWGKGPEINIIQLGGEGDYEKLGSYRGHLFDEYVNILNLDIDLVNEFENSEENSDDDLTLSDALSFLIAVTILHEYVHYNDFVFGDNYWGELWSEDPFNPENEAGLIFEDSIFGEYVSRENAGIILRRIGGL